MTGPKGGWVPGWLGALCGVPLVCAVGVEQPPMAQFERIHHSFGMLLSDQVVTCGFKVTNAGQAPLRIPMVRPDCGCATTLLKRDELAPGESTELLVTYDARGAHGPVHKRILVFTTDPAQPQITLTFSAEVRKGVLLDPAMVQFRELRRQGTSRATLAMRSGTGKPVRLTSWEAPGAPWLSVQFQERGVDGEATLEVDGSRLPSGVMEGGQYLTLRTRETGACEVLVRWALHACITAEPSRITCVERAGKPIEIEVTLRHRQDRAFRVLEATASHAGMRVECLEGGVGPVQRVRVRLEATVLPGTYRETVRLKLDDPDQGELILPILAQLQDAKGHVPAR